MTEILRADLRRWVPLALLASTAWAGPALVQSAEVPSVEITPTSSLSLAAPAAVGNTVVVCTDLQAGQTLSQVTDSQGSTYQRLGSELGAGTLAGNTVELYRAPITNSGSTPLSVTFTGNSSGSELIVLEYSGLDPVAPLEGMTVTNSTTQFNIDAGTLVTQSPNALLFAWIVDLNTVTAAGTGWTIVSTVGADMAISQVATVPGTYSATATADNQDWESIYVAFAAAQPDAGAVDGGAADAGLFDGGAVDGGGVDAGSIDGGVPDAGPATRRTLAVGCGSSPGSGWPWAIVLIPLRRVGGRRRRRS